MGKNSRIKYLKTSTVSIYERNIINMANEVLSNSTIERESIAFQQAQIEINQLNKEISNIRASWAYRIGPFCNVFTP